MAISDTISDEDFEWALLKKFSWIAWAEPLKVSISGEQDGQMSCEQDGQMSYACRVCAARHGLSVSDFIEGEAANADDIRRHIAAEHPGIAKSEGVK